MLAIAPAAAQESPRDAMASVNPSDAAVEPPLAATVFVADTAAKLQFMIEAAALAQIKGDEDSKVYARRVAGEQKALLAEMKSLASRAPLKLAVAAEARAGDLQALDDMRPLYGAVFDDLYDPLQIKVHEEIVTLLEQYADKGDNPALKQWAARTLPKLKRSLATAVQLK